MKKIGFYYKNKKFENIDCENFAYSNPGIGGAHYAMLLLIDATYKYASDVDVYVFVESKRNVPSKFKTILVNDFTLGDLLLENPMDFLIINKTDKTTATKDLISSIPEYINIILWAHCFIPWKMLNYYSKNNKIKRIVTVGKEQLITFCDHPASSKSISIYNIFNHRSLDVEKLEKENFVTYIGSIVSVKGLHLLTNVWPSIIKEIPDAKLFIIGSGKLYNNNQTLGPRGIAEFFYEEKLLQNILENGEIMPSVKFCGIMGEEKNRILELTKVGVPNPSGLTETFGYTALELQEFNARIVTKRCAGYSETVYDQTFMYNDTKNLAKNIILALKCYKENVNVPDSFYLQYSPEKIVSEWMKVIDNILDDTILNEKFENTRVPKHKKYLINRKLIKRSRIFPPLIFYESIFVKIGYYLSKLKNPITTIRKIKSRYGKKKIN